MRLLEKLMTELPRHAEEGSYATEVSCSTLQRALQQQNDMPQVAAAKLALLQQLLLSLINSAVSPSQVAIQDESGRAISDQCGGISVCELHRFEFTGDTVSSEAQRWIRFLALFISSSAPLHPLPTGRGGEERRENHAS
ncbi:hypothetical protein D5085_00910 [Ectothiorhodospiraceae bacterium BW-2]|nr:hypothetical protein D5085_00910 [Ectothiorhodospiraceae bacterium BW-2]